MSREESFYIYIIYEFSFSLLRDGKCFFFFLQNTCWGIRNPCNETVLPLNARQDKLITSHYSSAGHVSGYFYSFVFQRRSFVLVDEVHRLFCLWRSESCSESLTPTQATAAAAAAALWEPHDFVVSAFSSARHRPTDHPAGGEVTPWQTQAVTFSSWVALRQRFWIFYIRSSLINILCI